MDTRLNLHRPSSDEVSAMIAHLQQSFKEVGRIITENAGNIAFKDKLDGSPVTEIDKQVEDLLLRSFEAAFPGIPIYGEESGYTDSLPDFFWLIDPIDGTKSFIENIPAFTSMAVLIVGDETVASIIYNPSTDEMFIAQKNLGAYKNGEKLMLSLKPLPKKAASKGRYFELLNSFMEPAGVTCELAPVGAGFGFARVAEGQIAARFQLGSQGYIHDYATGALLVQEAGGAIIPVKDSSYNFRSKSFVACHPGLAPTIVDHLNEIRKMEEEL
jgi:fructose-1,6-bisphosphatase/inositol monophosphatase family enzyme